MVVCVNFVSRTGNKSLLYNIKATLDYLSFNITDSLRK